MKGVSYERNPFKCIEAEAYVTAINILAVEYLIKTNDPEEYSRRIHQVYSLTDDDLSILWCRLSINMHTSTLGAMITQGDYDHQLENLFEFLDHPEEWRNDE